jgi:hypothetical protein
MLLFGVMLVALSHGRVTAEPKEKSTAQAAAEIPNPFSPAVKQIDLDPFEIFPSSAPVDAAAYMPHEAMDGVLQTSAEETTLPPPADAQANSTSADATKTSNDPCAATNFKPLRQLGISIAQPVGQMPTDFATACWEQINSGPNGACRCWPVTCYHWDATCLCYQPLYFEQVNAERFGYGCGLGRFRYCTNCVQSAVSAAHFFGTVPALPYCLSARCPCDCVYTLGHYRAGDCVPWRCNGPSCDPFAAASAGGIYTGLIFAIP